MARQVNVRIDDADLRVLAIGALLEDSAIPDEVRLAIQNRVAELRADPDVQDMLRIRDRRQEKTGPPKVSSLDARRNRSDKGNA